MQEDMLQHQVVFFLLQQSLAVIHYKPLLQLECFCSTSPPALQRLYNPFSN